MAKEKILFLCTGNSCRSQMAEGLGKTFLSDTFDVFSAGIESHGLNPYAVKVMAEIDIDISGHRSKTPDDLEEREFEYVVTVCDHAHEHCPYFPAKTRVIHQGFDDPPRLARDEDSEEGKLSHYRRVRDEIKAFILSIAKNGL